ncbi:magnesium chelatase subunit ChlI family protein [Neorhodopirellula lusitana]|uniref:magnesium chelatase subunit ChlI family protein n=1 Tax=Neorhodopirellula lusitana TaxID=445327 RepID=UPI0038512FAD
MEVPAVPFEELSARKATTESSANMREHVVKAREVQTERFRDSPVRYNAQMTSRQVREYCELSPAGTQLLRAGVESLGLSARAHDKILRVSRTIADIAGSPSIEEDHLAEAISYRNLDADIWV